MKNFFRPIHLMALGTYLAYTSIAKLILAWSVLYPNSLQAYLVSSIASGIFAFIFLYIFSHEDFFKFAKFLKSNHAKKEKKLIKNYLHFGKVTATVIIGVLIGAFFSALTARILLDKYRYKYLVVIISSMISPFFTVTLLRIFLPQFLNLVGW